MNDKTELINFFGKKILVPNNKIYFSEEYYRKETKDSVVHTLKLEVQFPDKKITFYKDEEPNYDEVINYCKNKYTQSNKKIINYRFYIIPLLIICSGLLFFLFTRNCYKKQEQDNIVSIRDFGYIKLEGTFKDYKNKGKSTKIVLHLKEYPKFEFSPVDSLQYSPNFYSKLNEGSTVNIYITHNEYYKKIKKTIPPNFYDTYFNYTEIKIYNLE
ncbi:hypothetical protein [Chryseobacterium sp. JAH]|uniref:hypothetical protein n=1 Tax=Chryseobacterium sp. JAH TaxID=1742858 RepID=UPI0010417B07|nr:hypothetical protein [Chryseobacterium sp. JAH]